MTTTTLESAVSGPPPVATRHDHQGVIVTRIERAGRRVVQNANHRHREGATRRVG